MTAFRRTPRSLTHLKTDGHPITSRAPSLWPWLTALLFALILASLDGDGVKDRLNYLAFAANAPIQALGWLNGNLLAVLSNEPIWTLLNLGLGLFLQPEQVIAAYVLVFAFIAAYSLFRAQPHHMWLMLCILLIPQVLQNYVVHLRQGAAISIFLMGWFARSRRTRLVLFAICPFIHSSFFFVLLLWLVGKILQRLEADFVTALTCYTALGVTIGVELGVLAQSLHARQFDEYTFAADQGISGLGFVYWLIILGILLTQRHRFFLEHILEIGSLVFYLATYFLSPITARVFEDTLILIMLSSLKMKGVSRPLFIYYNLLFGAAQWLMIYLGLAATFYV